MRIIWIINFLKICIRQWTLSSYAWHGHRESNFFETIIFDVRSGKNLRFNTRPGTEYTTVFSVLSSLNFLLWVRFDTMQSLSMLVKSNCDSGKNNLEWLKPVWLNDTTQGSFYKYRCICMFLARSWWLS